MLDETRVSLSPGQGETSSTDRERWFLTGPQVTVNVASGFAVQGRSWREGEVPPAFASFSGACSFTGVTEGETRAFVQLRDVCGIESEVYELALVRDSTAPLVEQVRLQSGAAFTRLPTVTLAVSGADELLGTLTMRTTTCDVDATG